MSVYILKDKTYEIFNNVSKEEDKSSLTPKQLNNIASVLSEHFGCYMLFGMSMQGNPQVLLSAGCGMEHLALKKFAEDVVMENTDMSFVALDQNGEEEEAE